MMADKKDIDSTKKCGDTENMNNDKLILLKAAISQLDLAEAEHKKVETNGRSHAGFKAALAEAAYHVTAARAMIRAVVNSEEVK